MGAAGEADEGLTRRFATMRGELTYAQLADAVAPNQYTTALAHYDNGRIDPLIEFWTERLASEP